MKLKIEEVDRHYKSDKLPHGRLIKKFFFELIRNIFNISYQYCLAYEDYSGQKEVSLTYNEIKLYSTFAAALHQITPVHLSEFPFDKEECKSIKERKKHNPNEETEGRRVDFWCMHKESDSGKALNYFIELKVEDFYVGEDRDEENIVDQLKKTIINLESQLLSLKDLKPNWKGDGDVYLGLLVIRGFHDKADQIIHEDSHETIIEACNKVCDDRLRFHRLFSTWCIPTKSQFDEYDDYRYPSITIMGLVASRYSEA